MVYQFKKAACIKADAQKTGELCETLEATVGLTPKTLLNASRAEDSLLHNEFEWNDTIAAENYREQQAGHIIRSLIVVSESVEDVTPIRAFCSVKSDSNRDYKSISVIVNSPDLYAELMKQVINELTAFKQKYNTLSNDFKLKNLFYEIDETLKNIKAEKEN